MIRIKIHNILSGLLGLVLFLPQINGQDPEDFPRDTSFTVWGSYQKIRKEFPQARPVREFEDLNILYERNVVYCRAGSRDLHMDIFTPAETVNTKRPAVICIHGGGWASGNKSHLVPLAQKLAENGYVAATVEYRLSPEAKYPAGVFDIKTAIMWIKSNADIYLIDTAKIVVLGTSAGATIASLVAFTPDNPLFRTPSPGIKISDRVHALVNIDGTLDFTVPSESNKDSDPAKPSAAARWFGSTYRQMPDTWKEASPLTYMYEGSLPTLFINSAIPRFHAGRDEYLELLEKKSIYCEVHTIPGTPHPFWLFYPWFDETVNNITTFLKVIYN